MPAVVPAEGTILQRVLASTPLASCRGLTRAAFVTFSAAQARTPWAVRHLRRFAMLEGDDVLASAARYDLSVVVDQQPLTTCAIGAVLHHAAGEGAHVHADLLVQRLIDDASRIGADLALLVRQPNTASPVPDGFAVVPTIEAELAVAESARHGAPMTMVRVGEDRDLGAIVAMGRVRAGQCRFHVDRDAELIRHAMTTKRLLAGLGAAGVRQLTFVIAEEGTTAAAYVVISVAGATWTIEECGDRDASGARVGALLQALIARDPAESRPVIRGWLPPGFVPPQVSIAAARPAAAVLFARPLSTRCPPLHLSTADVLYWRNDLF